MVSLMGQWLSCMFVQHLAQWETDLMGAAESTK